jgi:tRNA (guanine-N7-)-methyltransferase
VRREGRITKAQERALTDLMPRYALAADGRPIDLQAGFGRAARCVLEIGFGNGEALIALAAAHPEVNYLGIEVHRPGVGRLLNHLAELELTNVRVLCADALEVLAQIPEASLDAVLVFFPDPWPKKRHHKRRIVQPAVVALIERKLRPGGRLHLATDWEDYAAHMLAVVSTCAGLRNTAGEGCYAPRPEYRPLTKFERRGRRLGHAVWDLVFERTD